MNQAPLFNWHRLMDHGRPAARLDAALRGPEALQGHVNQALVFSGLRTEFEAESEQLSAKLVLQGRVRFCVGRRTLQLQPGHVLLLNPGTRYAAWSSEQDGGFVGATVWFRRGLLAETAEMARLAPDPQAPRAEPVLSDRLRPQDAVTAGLIAHLAQSLLHGEGDDPEALDQDLSQLLHRWWLSECGHRQAADRLGAAREATRRELLRRLDRAVDFMISCQAQPLSLEQIAQESALSRSYLIRLFVQVHGMTPHRFLERLRARAARSLLAQQGLGLEAVAQATGFGSRWTMQRALRRHYGASGRGLRSEPGPARP